MSGERIHLDFECDEPWDEMTPEGEGRRCARCDHVVIDLSAMPKKRALEVLQRDACCISFLEMPSGRPLFRPQPHRAGALAGVAAGLLAACGGPEAAPPPSAPTTTVPIAILPVAPPASLAVPPTATDLAAPPPPADLAAAPTAPIADEAVDPADCDDDPAAVAALDPPADAVDPPIQPIRRRGGRRHAPTHVTPIPPARIR